jgi:hypothetical protein
MRGRDRRFSVSRHDVSPIGPANSSGSKSPLVRRTIRGSCVTVHPGVDLDDEGQGDILSFGPRHVGLVRAWLLQCACQSDARQRDACAICPTRRFQRPGSAASRADFGPPAQRPHRRRLQRLGCQKKNPQQAIPSARSRSRSQRPPLQRSSSKLAALSTMRAVGRALAQTIPCEMAGPVAGGALTPDLAGLRRFAIRAM